MQPVLLIVDDEKATREGLRIALESEFDVFLASNEKEALVVLENEKVHLVLTDLRLGGSNGMNLLDFITKMDDAPVTIMMTAYGSVDTAVEAMRRGAWYFITKPLNLNEVEILLKRALKSHCLEEENQALKEVVAERRNLKNLLGKSKAIQDTIRIIEQVAPTKTTILIEGESGTGKEVAANTIHQLSGRPAAKFVIVHCAALSAQLLESELFGHEKGSFTGASQRRIGRFEQADGGSIFLDEIGEIDAATQVKLLRVLSEKTIERVGSNQTVKVNVRVIAATNRNLKDMVDRGEFRQDLYFRLNVVKIQMPALRDRGDDVLLLAKEFIEEFSKENGRASKFLSDEATQLLLAYSWPGNVRELRSVMEHSVVMCDKKILGVESLPSFLRENELSYEINRHIEPLTAFSDQQSKFNLYELETSTIKQVLLKTLGNRTVAAELLGISRRTLQRKLKDLKIPSSNISI
jgi:two-component system, NtrC family, response regulator AtoC